MMHDFLKEAQGMAEKLTAFRHDLHRHPEVGIDLPRTTKKVEEVLEKAGIPYSNPIPSSILVVLKGGSPGKTFLLRADMDATMLLGAALLLNKYRENLPGIVKLPWQPGEEIFGGMKPLVEAGILESPKVDATFDMHDDVTSPLGTVTYSDEAFTTAATNFSISIRGRGGHGGFPNTTIDPINIAVQIYQGMQAMQAREIAPADYLALSICSIQAGSSYNIIPDTAGSWEPCAAMTRRSTKRSWTASGNSWMRMLPPVTRRPSWSSP